MPAPRKRPDSRVPEPVAEVCNAVIDLLERASITNEQFLVRRPDLGMNPKSMSRHLLGQARPAPALVEAVVVVVATELGVEIDGIYDEFLPLRRYTGQVELHTEANAQPDIRPVPVVHRRLGSADWQQRTGWWWSLIVDGREFEAAVALDGLFGGDSEAEDRAVALLALRDPGAVAALLRAVEEVLGPDRAQNLLAAAESVGMGASTAVMEIPNFYLSDVPPPWGTSDARLLDRSPERLISRRLAALLRRGEEKQACAEMAALTESVGVDTADVMAAMIDDLDAGAAGELLTAMISGDDIDAAEAILSAVLAQRRSSGRPMTAQVLIGGLLPEHLGRVLELLIYRSRRATDPIPETKLRELLTFTSGKWLIASLAWATTHNVGDLDYVFDLLLEEEELESLLNEGDSDSVAAVLTTVVAQFEHRAPADHDRMMSAVIREIKPHVVTPLMETHPQLAARMLWQALTQPESGIHTFLRDYPGEPAVLARFVLVAEPKHRVELLSALAPGPRGLSAWNTIIDQNESAAREIMLAAILSDPGLAAELAMLVYRDIRQPAWRDAAEYLKIGDLSGAHAIVVRAPFSGRPRSGFISRMVSAWRDIETEPRQML